MVCITSMLTIIAVVSEFKRVRKNRVGGGFPQKRIPQNRKMPRNGLLSRRPFFIYPLHSGHKEAFYGVSGKKQRKRRNTDG